MVNNPIAESSLRDAEGDVATQKRRARIASPAARHDDVITFLHGWAMHGGLFRPLFDQLKGDFNCTRLDLPGHGFNREMAWPDAIEDWIAQQVPEGSWLAGWSLGGLLALRTAILSSRPKRSGEPGSLPGTQEIPDSAYSASGMTKEQEAVSPAGMPGAESGTPWSEHIQGLILIAATPCFLHRPHWPHGIAAKQLDALGAELAHEPTAVINRFLALEVHGDQDAAAQLRLLRREALTHGLPDAGALRIGLDLLRDTDLTEQLGEIDIPVLVLGGRRDRLVNWQALETMAERLPRAQLVRIPGAAHAPFVTRAGAVAEAIRGFVLNTRQEKSSAHNGDN